MSRTISYRQWKRMQVRQSRVEEELRRIKSGYYRKDNFNDDEWSLLKAKRRNELRVSGAEGGGNFTPSVGKSDKRRSVLQ